MDYIAKLKEYKKKTIKRSEMETLFSAFSDEKLYRIVIGLVEKRILSPVKNSQTNGNRQYPLFDKYRVTLPHDTYEVEMTEISVLHTMLLEKGYLQANPEEYKKHRDIIQKLDRYLFRHHGAPIPISRKERSFEIFDEEKVLDNKVVCTLLDSLGLTADVLRYYDTPECCFNDFIPKKMPRMTLLICENKDIWFNIRRMMFEDKAKTIFGTPIDGVVYGCGNMVSGKGALTAYTRFVGAEVDYLYWGDIDRAGLNIYLSTLRSNPELNIQLFVQAYEEMLCLAQTRNIPNSDDGREYMENYESVYNCFNSTLRQSLEVSIAGNKRIPQEIITYAYLKNVMR